MGKIRDTFSGGVGGRIMRIEILGLISGSPNFAKVPFMTRIYNSNCIKAPRKASQQVGSQQL